MKTRLATTFLTVALAALPALGATPADGVTSQKFDVLLSPSHENPPILGTDVSGKAVIEFNVHRTSGAITMVVVDFHVDWRAGQAETLRAMHIHMAPAGSNGGIVIPTALGPQPAALGGTIFQQVKIMDPAGIDTVKQIMAKPGDFYLNIHSTSHPPGLLRGQLEPDAATQLGEMRTILDHLANFIL